MWQITIYLAVATKHNGKPTQQSSCAIQLDGHSPQGTASRTMTQFLDNKSQAQAEIYGAIAALTAVKERGKAHVELHSSSTQLVKLLTKDPDGEWDEPQKHQGLTSKLRELYDWFTTPEAILDHTSDHIKQVTQSAKTSLAAKSHSDTGTQLAPI